MTSTTAGNPVALSFVDTNVFVYAYDRGEPEKRQSALTLLESTDPDELVISSQVLGEFFTVVTRKLTTPLSHEHAADAVRALSALTVVPVDAALVDEALELLVAEQLSYWDALIVAAARRSGCTRILTEDLRTGRVVAGLRIENPFSV